MPLPKCSRCGNEMAVIEGEPAFCLVCPVRPFSNRRKKEKKAMRKERSKMHHTPDDLESAAPIEGPVCLHVGCGSETKMPSMFDGYKQVRLDLDPSCNPDVVDDISRLEKVADGSVAAIYSSHNLEHLNLYDCEQAILNWKRVLKPDGRIVVLVPDFEWACKQVVEGNLFRKAYDSPAGPIMVHDMIFGWARVTRSTDSGFMAHKMGFTRESLEALFARHGFQCSVSRADFNLIAMARKFT